MKRNLTLMNSSTEMFQNENMTTYPFPRLCSLPVINSSIGELIYLYIPQTEYEFINIELKPLNRAVFRDYEVIQKLKSAIFSYCKQVFNSNDLEDRIQLSYENELKDIQANVSLAIEMDSKFKAKRGIAEKLNNFRDIKNAVLKNAVMQQSRQNPFDGAEQTGKKKKLLKKMGLSFIETENIIEEVDEKLELLDDVLKPPSEKKKTYTDYKTMIRTLFCKKLNDFRKDIVEYVIANDKDFTDTNFDKFVFYLEFFIILFSGIRTKYYIDELSYLNMDFYASERTFMNIAETFHYQVQFKILDIPIITDSKNNLFDKTGKQISDKKLFKHQKQKIINDINRVQNEDYTLSEVEYFPPYTNFIKVISSKFRRYETNDDYHSCPECEKTTDYKKGYQHSCSSCFRFLDKTRLIYSMLSNIIDMNTLEKAIASKRDEKFNGIFKTILILHNQKTINELLQPNTIIKGFINPINVKDTRILNKAYRNLFGEEIGFYYTWITHYIKWLLFPSVIGLSIHICKYFFDTNSYLTINLLFAAIVVLWGSYYVESWKALEPIYRYIWGMENYRLEKATDILKQNSDKVKIAHFMGVKIPIYNTFDKFVKNLFSFVVISVTLLFTICVNLLIFYIERSNLYENDDSPLASHKLKAITKGYLLYAIPITTYFVRELLSSMNKKVAKWLTNFENNITKVEYTNSYLKKQLCFEFFNYYFNLYYIAFGKRYLEFCLFGNCFVELGNQLSIIILSNITVIATKVFYNGLYRRNQTKKFEQKVLEKYLTNDNASKKFIYYTRTEFDEDDVSSLILPIVFNFGYILQFGASSPISFFFVLLLVLFMRLTNGISMAHLFYVKTTNESNGIGLFNGLQGLIAFLGLFTNLCIIFYTNKEFIPLNSTEKLFYLVITENIVFLILKVFYYARIPEWFSYKTKIELKYLKKHGIRPKSYKEK